MTNCTDEGASVPLNVREIIATIEADGWVQVRQRGSHRQVAIQLV
jgi:predicted RNA binding protein YcfA (HicA-like mRNA interferase family)